MCGSYHIKNVKIYFCLLVSFPFDKKMTTTSRGLWWLGESYKKASLSVNIFILHEITYISIEKVTLYIRDNKPYVQ